MKRIIYLFSYLLAVAFLFNGCQIDPKQDQISPEIQNPNYNLKANETGCSVELVAGQNTVVGYVTSEFSANNTILTVEYEITDPAWCILETHLDVQLDPDNFPMNNAGNPKVGQFEYGETLECADSWSIDIDISEFITENDPCPELFIAAHAVVKELSCYQTGILYGINRNDGKIYGIDVVGGTAWEEFTVVAPPTGSAKPNGLAYDGVNQRMYYCSYQSTPTTLYFWDGEENVAGDLGDVQIANADFYDGKYYYIESSNSDDLYEVVFDVDGSVVSNDKIDDIASDAHGWTFNGDIAIKDGILYGWGKCGIDNVYEFFTYNLGTGDFTINKTAYQDFSMQLAFGSDGVLYGHKSNASGNAYFYEVDITNGNLSNETLIDPDLAYTDCASGMQCVPETETAWAGDIDFPGNSWATYFNCQAPCCDEWVVFGSNLGESDVIYSIDLKNKNVTLVYDPGQISSSVNYPNGNAYDPINQRIYFGTDDGKLFYYDIPGGTHELVGSAYGTIACGAWYDGHYYYVKNGTKELYKVAEDGTASKIGTVPSGTGNYGDIVFDPANQGVFIASSGSPTAVWYWYDLYDNTSGTLSRTGGPTKHLQLAYGSDGVLYGVEAVSGEFFIVEYDIDGGTVNLSPYWDSDYSFTDLASGPQCP